MFIIDILKEFNNIHESIYEKPKNIGNIVSTHFGPNFGKLIENHLTQEAIDAEFEENMELFQNTDHNV